jgi:hypothetical protein
MKSTTGIRNPSKDQRAFVTATSKRDGIGWLNDSYRRKHSCWEYLFPVEEAN